MPLIEYLLLALLGPGGVKLVAPATATFGPDAIAQPAGGAAVGRDFESGAGLVGQEGGGSPGRAHKGKLNTKASHSHKTGHKGKVYHKGRSAHKVGRSGQSAKAPLNPQPLPPSPPGPDSSRSTRNAKTKQ